MHEKALNFQLAYNEWLDARATALGHTTQLSYLQTLPSNFAQKLQIEGKTKDQCSKMLDACGQSLPRALEYAILLKDAHLALNIMSHPKIFRLLRSNVKFVHELYLSIVSLEVDDKINKALKDGFNDYVLHYSGLPLKDLAEFPNYKEYAETALNRTNLVKNIAVAGMAGVTAYSISYFAFSLGCDGFITNSLAAISLFALPILSQVAAYKIAVATSLCTCATLIKDQNLTSLVVLSAAMVLVDNIFQHPEQYFSRVQYSHPDTTHCVPRL